MNGAILNGVLRVAGLACLVAAAALAGGLSAALATAGAGLIAQTLTLRKGPTHV